MLQQAPGVRWLDTAGYTPPRRNAYSSSSRRISSEAQASHSQSSKLGERSRYVLHDRNVALLLGFTFDNLMRYVTIEPRT